jgi:hypothetical protein
MSHLLFALFGNQCDQVLSCQYLYGMLFASTTPKGHQIVIATPAPTTQLAPTNIPTKSLPILQQRQVIRDGGWQSGPRIVTAVDWNGTSARICTDNERRALLVVR